MSFWRPSKAFWVSDQLFFVIFYRAKCCFFCINYEGTLSSKQLFLEYSVCSCSLSVFVFTEQVWSSCGYTYSLVLQWRSLRQTPTCLPTRSRPKSSNDAGSKLVLVQRSCCLGVQFFTHFHIKFVYQSYKRLRFPKDNTMDRYYVRTWLP